MEPTVGPTSLNLLLPTSFSFPGSLYKYITTSHSLSLHFSFLFANPFLSTMEHFNNDDLEYVVDEYYDVPDFAVEDTSSDIVPELTSDVDSDFEDEFPTVI